MPDEITFTIDGVQVKAKPGQTILQAAIDAGVYIPYLCYFPGMKPYGACRACLVEVEGGRGAPASCTTPVAPNMVVKSDTPLVKALRKGVLELLMSEHPHGCLSCHRIELCGPQDICLRHVRVTDRCVVCPKNERCELKDTVRLVGISMELPTSYNYRNLPIHTQDPFYDRDYNLCIVCARCVRACDELRGDDAICMVERSGKALVGTSRGTSLLESGCEFCGACIDVCPVGALVERDYKWEKAAHSVYTTCPNCAVGCQMKLEVDRWQRVIRAVGDWNGEANHGQLCYRGKFGLDFANKAEQLHYPLVRRDGRLVEATWEEALDVIAQGLAPHKGEAYALLASPRSTNEDAYVAQKFARTVMGSNSVDTSTDSRPELVLGLADMLGVHAATGSTWQLLGARCTLVVNSNTTEDHNVMAVPIKQAHRKNGQKVIVVDPREVELTRYADLWLRPRPGTEVALIGGILRALLDESLEDKDFVYKSCEGIEELTRSLAHLDLVRVEGVTGVPQASIRQAARLFAKERPGAILYALDNVASEDRLALVHALVDLALLTGNVGKPSSGLFPLRSGTNEQGAWDVGCAPSFLPGYRPVADAAARDEVGKAWGASLPSAPGLGVRSVLAGLREGRVKAVQVIGDSPTFDAEALDALSQAQFLVVHEHFLSDLAKRANVVLPLSTFAQAQGSYTSLERRVQLVRRARSARAEEQPAWRALAQLAQRMGVKGFEYQDPGQVFGELAALMPAYRGLSHERLSKGGVQWPCPEEGHSGTPVLLAEGLGAGKAKLTPVESPKAPRESPAEYPLLLAPGRVLAQTQREMQVVSVEGLNRVQRDEVVELHPSDAAALGVAAGDMLEVAATSGARIRAVASLTGQLPGVVSITTLFGQLASQLQASSAPDRMLRVPGLEVVPVRLEKVAAS